MVLPLHNTLLTSDGARQPDVHLNPAHLWPQGEAGPATVRQLQYVSEEHWCTFSQWVNTPQRK